jgi:hypothetical protein
MDEDGPLNGRKRMKKVKTAKRGKSRQKKHLKKHLKKHGSRFLNPGK